MNYYRVIKVTENQRHLNRSNLLIFKTFSDYNVPFSVQVKNTLFLRLTNWKVFFLFKSLNALSNSNNKSFQCEVLHTQREYLKPQFWLIINCNAFFGRINYGRSSVWLWRLCKLHITKVACILFGNVVLSKAFF